MKILHLPLLPDMPGSAFGILMMALFLGTLLRMSKAESSLAIQQLF